MKKWNKALAALIAALVASCSPGTVAAQDATAAAISAANANMELAVELAQDDSITYTIDLIPIFAGAALVFVAYKLYKHFSKKKVDLKEASFKFQGNGNCYINNVTIDGQRIADIEIIDKNLYVNGVRKRRLANNSIIYNRGKGIFVDGKYVA